MLQLETGIYILVLKGNKYIYSNHLSHLQIKHESDTALKHAISALILKIKLLFIYSNMYYIMSVCGDDSLINYSNIRMGLSTLNGQRIKYNFFPEETCEMCNAES
jgi:hypothetical protein